MVHQGQAGPICEEIPPDLELRRSSDKISHTGCTTSALPCSIPHPVTTRLLIKAPLSGSQEGGLGNLLAPCIHIITASDSCVRRATPRVENVVIARRFLPLCPNPPAVQLFILLCTHPVNDNGLPIRDSEGRAFNSFW